MTQAPRNHRLDPSGTGSTRGKIVGLSIDQHPVFGFALTTADAKVPSSFEIDERSGEEVFLHDSSSRRVDLKRADATRLRQLFGGAMFASPTELEWALAKSVPAAEFEDAPFELGKEVGVMIFGMHVLGDEAACIHTLEFATSTEWDELYPRLCEDAESGDFPVLDFGPPFSQYVEEVNSKEELDRIYQAVPVDKATLKALSLIARNRRSGAFSVHEGLADLGYLTRDASIPL